MLPFEPDKYGPVFAPLLKTDRCRPLGPGKPTRSARESLDSLDPQAGLAHEKIVDPAMAELCCGAIWLLYDYLEESHKRSQQIDTDSGSYWHGIMHRREPDYQNAKYWFRRVGDHPIYAELHKGARELTREAELDDTIAALQTQKRWDPFLFIDMIETVTSQRAQSQSKEEQLLCKVQQYEWERLFDFCYRRAIGED